MDVFGPLESPLIVLLETINSEPERALRYLERYVNDGSPSGFTRAGQLGIETDPFGISPWYHPYIIMVEAEALEVFRDVPELPGWPKNGFLVHPDVLKHADIVGLNVGKLKSIKLIPTSSGRTGRILDPKCDYYLKFHYPLILGRVNRALPRLKAIAGPEMTSILESTILSGSLTPWLHILPETGALVLHLKPADNTTWGLIVRKARPFGPHADQVHAIVPIFAFWSTDRLKSFDLTILEQLVRYHGAHFVDSFLQRVLLAIIDAYFGLVTMLGLQIELNAQNVMVGLDAQLLPVAVIFRDLNAIEKDISMHQRIGLNKKYESSPYKEISKSINGPDYVIRHSFAFDFKLTHYVILPLVSSLAEIMQDEIEPLVEKIRDHVLQWLPRLPEDYFPEGNVWFAHEDIDLSRERPYVLRRNPLLR